LWEKVAAKPADEGGYLSFLTNPRQLFAIPGTIPRKFLFILRSSAGQKHGKAAARHSRAASHQHLTH
jgi:hypothetical protein